MVRLRQLLVVRAAAAAMVTLGAALVALSAFYVSSFLAILGLAMVFWGCILLYVAPVKHVPYDLLEAAADVNAGGVERVLSELNLSGKGVYLPPKNLKDIESSLVFIPLAPAVVEALITQETTFLPSEEPAAVSPYEVSLEAERGLPVSEAPAPVPVVSEAEVVEPVEVAPVPVVSEAVRVVEVERVAARSVSAVSVAVLPAGVVRPPSVRYAPSGKSAVETGFASVFDGGVDVVGDSLVGKCVRTRVEGDVGCVLRRRNTPLGFMVLVEFKWGAVEERVAHGGLPGEAVWFWLDEVEVVEPGEDLDSIGAAVLKELEEL